MAYPIVKAAGAVTLTHSWYVNGTATDVGAVTIGITDLHGTTVVAAGTATTNNANGTYTYTLADQSAVKLLTITWTDVDTGDDQTDSAEVIGGLLFTEPQARTFDNSALANTTTYTDDLIWQEHQRIADLLEQWTGRSWLPRYRRIKCEGDGGRVLWTREAIQSDGPSGGEGASRDIQSIITANDGAAVSTSNIVIYPREGKLHRIDSGWTVNAADNPVNVTIQYEYGMPRLIDGVDRIALLLLRDRLIPDPTDFGGRASSITTDYGVYRLSDTPAEVQSWVKNHSYYLPIV